MKKIYVAGPMRGYENYNFDAFDQARDVLRDVGWHVVSPTDIDRLHEGWGKYPPNDGFVHGDLIRFIRRDLELLMEFSPESDAIYMLRGWEHSKGAKLELAMAEFLGLKVFYKECENVE